jgi:tetratricopeptide (TPR) repeat protein
MPPRTLASLALALVLALVIGAGTAATAIAQPTPTASAEADEARRLSQQATADYKRGHFAEALTGYSAAYELFRAPQFLFNIAQCHFQLEQWDRAVFFFEGYLRELPAATNRALVEDLMREARDRRAEAQTTAQRKLDLEKQRLELERREAERAAAQRPLGPAIETPAPRPLYGKWWFWTGVGAVVIGAVTTAVILSSGTETVLPEGSLGTWDER